MESYNVDQFDCLPKIKAIIVCRIFMIGKQRDIDI